MGKESAQEGGYLSEYLNSQYGSPDSVEVRGRSWAQKDKRDILEGRKRPVIVAKVLYERPRNRGYTTFTGRTSASEPMFNDEGNLLIITWPRVQTEIDGQGRRRIVNPGGFFYEVLNPREVKLKDPNNLPHERVVVERRENVVGSIEKAIRLTGHVIEGSVRTEVNQARRIVKTTNELANAFLLGNIDRKGLERLTIRTGEELEATGLIRPKDPDKVKMLQMLLKASDMDKLGRVNPLISRVRVRSAYLAACKRMIIQGLVISKFEKIRSILVYEREMTRWILENAIDQLNIYVLGINTIKRPGSEDTYTQRHGLHTTLTTVANEIRSTARVKPYIFPASEASSNLIQSGDLVLTGQFLEARRIVESSMESLKKVLDENETLES